MLTAKVIRKIIVMIALCVVSLLAQATDDYSPRPITKSERCPVCGMYPANYPKWHSQIIFTDGEHSSFDSPIEMFRFIHNMAKYDSHHSAAQIGRLYVPAYETGEWLDAKDAFYVVGAKVSGPMGADLPAFANEELAQGFVKQSGGEVLDFSHVTAAVIKGVHNH